jgi:hypothetical protein
MRFSMCDAFFGAGRRRAGSPVSHAALSSDGSVNALHFQRPKDKLGNPNASSRSS